MLSFMICSKAQLYKHELCFFPSSLFLILREGDFSVSIDIYQFVRLNFFCFSPGLFLWPLPLAYIVSTFPKNLFNKWGVVIAGISSFIPIPKLIPPTLPLTALPISRCPQHLRNHHSFPFSRMASDIILAQHPVIHLSSQNKRLPSIQPSVYSSSCSGIVCM